MEAVASEEEWRMRRSFMNLISYFALVTAFVAIPHAREPLPGAAFLLDLRCALLLSGCNSLARHGLKRFCIDSWWDLHSCPCTFG